MRAGRAFIILALAMLALQVVFAAPSQEYIMPALSREVYLVDTSPILDNNNVYVAVGTNEQNILALLNWANEYNICPLAVDNDWLLPVVTYSSDADVQQRVKDYIILESGTYTFQHCYYEGTYIPITIYYPRKLLVHVGTLDTFNGEFNTFNHYIYVYQPYPIYDDFAGSAESWSSGCRDLNMPTAAIEPFILLGSNVIKSGSVELTTISVSYGNESSDVSVSKLFQFSDALSLITGRLGIGWTTLSSIDRVCYTGTPGDMYLLLIPRW